MEMHPHQRVREEMILKISGHASVQEALIVLGFVEVNKRVNVKPIFAPPPANCLGFILTPSSAERMISAPH